MQKKIAIIDLGSNSTRLLIMQICADGSYKIADQAKGMVRISEGMSADKRLKPVPMKRCLETLGQFQQLIKSHEADETVAVATAAVREASNQKEFLHLVEKETGLSFRVVSGEEEAYYSYLGVINTCSVDNCLIIDIGGGSTELIQVTGRKMREAVSIPYGAVNLTELFLDSDYIPPESLQALSKRIRKELQSILWLKKVQRLPLVGLGGTFRALARTKKKRINYPLKGVHNFILLKEDILRSLEQAAGATLEERADIPGINRERADIITAGFALAYQIMSHLKSPQLIVSGSGLREGVFYERYAAHLELPSPVFSDVQRMQVYYRKNGG